MNTYLPSFYTEKNTIVLKDKNGFIKKKYGFITCDVIIQQYPTISRIICVNQVMKSSYKKFFHPPQMLVICNECRKNM